MNRAITLVVVLLALFGCTRMPDRNAGSPAHRASSAGSPAMRSESPPSPVSEAVPSATMGEPAHSGSGSLRSATSDCDRVHEYQRWAPRETTTSPILKADCFDSDNCITIRPVTKHNPGCSNDGAHCQPIVILPQALASDSKKANAIQAILDETIEDVMPREDDCWLSFLDYTIHFDEHGILDVSFRISGSGAYPSTFTQHVSIAIATGRRITPDVSFRELAELARVVDKKLQAAVRTTPTVEPDHYKYNERATFDVGNLADFIVTPSGIVFRYDFGLPHVTRVASPDSEYLITPPELKHFIDLAGPLGWILGTPP